MSDAQAQIEDQILVMDAQDGDARAMARLVQRWQRRLWRYAYRLTGRSEAAWEVTQETWLAAVRGLGRLEDPARFSGWLYRIATRKAQDWIRQTCRHRHADLAAVAEHAAAPGGRSDVVEALARLRPGHRTVLCLYYGESLSVGQISEVLGVPTGTVKSRLHAARAAFKSIWLAPSGSAQRENDHES